MSREQRSAVVGVDCPSELVWRVWEAGGELTKYLVVRNVTTKSLTVCYELPETRFFSMQFPESVTLSPGVAATLAVSFRPVEDGVEYLDAVRIVVMSPLEHRLTTHDDGTPKTPSSSRAASRSVRPSSGGAASDRPDLTVDDLGAGDAAKVGHSFSVALRAALPSMSMATPNEVDFGMCAVKEVARTSFVVSNSGEVPLRFSFNVPPPFVVEPAAGDLLPGNTATISASFTPADASILTANATVTATSLEDPGRPPSAAQTGARDMGLTYPGLTADRLNGNPGSTTANAAARTNEPEQSYSFPIRASGKFPFLVADVERVDFGRQSLAKRSERATRAAQTTALNASLRATAGGGDGLDQFGGKPAVSSATVVAERTVTITNRALVSATFSVTSSGRVPCFSTSTRTVRIDGGASADLVFRYHGSVPGVEYVDQFAIASPGSNTVFVNVTGESVGPDLVPSTAAIDFGDQRVGARVKRRFELRNDGAAPAWFEFDNPPVGVFKVGTPSGLVRAGSVSTFYVYYTPSHAVNSHLRLAILVEYGEPLFLDLYGTAFADSSRPPPIRQEHIDRLPRIIAAGLSHLPPERLVAHVGALQLMPEDADAAREEALAARLEPPAMLFGSVRSEVVVEPAALDFGTVIPVGSASAMLAETNSRGGDPSGNGVGVVVRSSGGAGGRADRRLPRRVEVRNTTLGKLECHWSAPKGSAFRIEPADFDIEPESSALVTVAFDPPEDNQFYSAVLECAVTFKTMRNFRLVGQEAFCVPWTLRLPVEGNTFVGGLNLFTEDACFDVPHDIVTFPSCPVGETTVQTVRLVNRHPEPVHFDLDLVGADGSAFSVYPSSGVVPGGGGFRLIMLAFAPRQWAAVAAQLVCRLNHTDAVSLALNLGAEAALPELALEASKLFFKPTCLGLETTRPFSLRNTSSVPLYFAWVLPDGMGDVVGVEPEVGVVPPRETVATVWHFAPTQTRLYRFKASVLWGGSERLDPDAPTTTATTVPVIANCTQPVLTFEPEEVDFGVTALFSLNRAEITLFNSSEAGLRCYFEAQVEADPSQGGVSMAPGTAGGPGAADDPLNITFASLGSMHTSSLGFSVRSGGGEIGSRGGARDGGNITRLVHGLGDSGRPVSSGAVGNPNDGTNDDDDDGNTLSPHTALLLEDGRPMFEVDPPAVDIPGRSYKTITVVLKPRYPRRYTVRLLCRIAAAAGMDAILSAASAVESGPVVTVAHRRGSSVALRPPSQLAPSQLARSQAGSSSRADDGGLAFLSALVSPGEARSGVQAVGPVARNAMFELPVCRVTADAERPTLQVRDILSENTSKPSLWDWMNVEALNAELQRPVSAAELEFMSDAVASSGAVDVEATPIEALPEVQMTFQARVVGAEPVVTYMQLHNPGLIPVKWAWELAARRETGVEEWSSLGHLTDQELSTNRILPAEIMQVSPPSGTLEPGAVALVAVTIHHRFEGHYAIQTLIRLARGKQIHVRVAVHTLRPSVPFLTLARPVHSFDPVVVGTQDSPIQRYRLYNTGPVAIDFAIQSGPLEQLAADNYGFEVLKCLTPTGSIPAGGYYDVQFKFNPLEVVEYQVDLVVDVLPDRPAFATVELRAYGCGHRTRSELLSTASDASTMPIAQQIIGARQFAILSVERLWFGHVPLLSRNSAFLTVTNLRDRDAIKVEFLVEPDYAARVAIEPASVVIPGGGQRCFHVTFVSSVIPEILDIDVRCVATSLREVKRRKKTEERRAQQAAATEDAINVEDYPFAHDVRSRHRLAHVSAVTNTRLQKSKKAARKLQDTIHLRIQAWAFPPDQYKLLHGDFSSYYVPRFATSDAAHARAAAARELDRARKKPTRALIRMMNAIPSRSEMAEALAETVATMLQDIIFDPDMQSTIVAVEQSPVPYYCQLVTPPRFAATPARGAGGGVGGKAVGGPPVPAPGDVLPEVPMEKRVYLGGSEPPPAPVPAAAETGDAAAEPVPAPSAESGADAEAAEAVVAEKKPAPLWGKWVRSHALPRLEMAVTVQPQDEIEREIITMPEFQELTEYVMSEMVFNLMEEAVFDEFNIFRAPRMVVVDDGEGGE